MGKLQLYYQTIRQLKWTQIRYRAWYLIRNRWRRATGFRYAAATETTGQLLRCSAMVHAHESYLGNDRFRFLNKEQQFSNGRIDWSFNGHGKLWAYNLNYFEFLNQQDITREQGLDLIHRFIADTAYPSTSYEPYPISLRLIFWIRFLSRHGIQDPVINASIHLQQQVLLDHLEYHILGNHLLENGFALLHAAYFTGSPKAYAAAADILTAELEEQVLSDGAHFELSPMYHQTMLYRLLDCIDIMQHNEAPFKVSILPMLQEKAGKMLGWLNHLTFSNGDIALFNDSAFGIAPDTASLKRYADHLGIATVQLPLGASGYRCFNVAAMELKVDAGIAGPSYIAGHVHCDMLSFESYVHGRPVIVDGGTSTYEANERRLTERGTASHNTVLCDGDEQSEVWSAFRTGRQASIRILQEAVDRLDAVCTHFSNGLRHERSFNISDQALTIIDRTNGTARPTFAMLHFHPSCKVVLKDDTVTVNDAMTIRFSGHQEIQVGTFRYAPQFGRTVEAPLLRIAFSDKLQTHLQIS